MLNCSGFGWDDQKKMVEVASAEVMEAWSKTKGVSLCSPGKPFPAFERLARIFGKDRANGGYAVQGNDIDQDSYTRDPDPMMNGDTFDETAFTETACTDTAFTETEGSVPRRATSELHQRKSKRLKKNNDTELFGQLVEQVKTTYENQGRQIQIIANAVSGFNEEVNLSRTLRQLGYNSQEIVKIAVKFTQNPELKRTFWSLGEERKDFVDTIMQE